MKKAHKVFHKFQQEHTCLTGFYEIDILPQFDICSFFLRKDKK